MYGSPKSGFWSESEQRWIDLPPVRHSNTTDAQWTEMNARDEHRYAHPSHSRWSDERIERWEDFN